MRAEVIKEAMMAVVVGENGDGESATEMEE